MSRTPPRAALVLALAGLVLRAGAEVLPGRLPGGLQLVFPRGTKAGENPVLATMDSLLVNGNIAARPGQRVSLNVAGLPVELLPDGRFATQIPFPTDRRLVLDWAIDDLPFQTVQRLDSPAPAPAPVTPAAPGWVTSGSPLKLSTAPGASYWLFPDAGTPLLLGDATRGGSRVLLCEGLEAWLPASTRLDRLASAPERPARVGSIVVDEDGLGLRFSCAGGPLPVWLETDARAAVIRLLLPGAVAAIDRVRLAPAGPLLSVEWEPRPGPLLELRLQLEPGSVDGARVQWQGNQLALSLNPREHSLRDWNVVLDPGHGGSELGCVGASGTSEAELNLLLAQEIGARLEQAGAQVHYTRTDERTVSLDARVAFADSVKADFFLSVHHNSTSADGDPRATRGYSVYWWNGFSAEPARLLHAGLCEGPFADDGLFWRSLAVCRQEGRPALLLEAGTLINPDEETLLLQPQTRHRQSRLIVQALKEYLRGD